MLEAFIDAPQRLRGLSIFPVTAAHGPTQAFLLLEEARDSKALEIRAKCDEADPIFLARNQSLHAILVLRGETLLREVPGQIADCSFLLPGKSVTVIPSARVSSAEGPQVDKAEDVEAWLHAFPLLEGQLGVLAVLGRRVLGLEAFGCPRLFAHHHKRLVSQFVLQALALEDAEGESLIDWSASLQREDAALLVEALEEAGRTQIEALGVGECWSLEGSVVGGELIHEKQLVHVSARPAPAASSSEPR